MEITKQTTMKMTMNRIKTLPQGTILTVRCIKGFYVGSLEKGKIYKGKVVQRHGLAVFDEDRDWYGYPPSDFEFVKIGWDEQECGS